MKRFFTLAILGLLFQLSVDAQSNTMLMIEEGTQASCPPCATQNPGFDALLLANNEKVVVLKYQTWWPGFDQMYNDNPTPVQNRIGYYDISGVPTAVMNGALWANDCGAWEGAPACLSQAEIDAAHAVISPLTMDISGVFDNGALKVTGTITADMDLSGDLKLRVAVTEQRIEIADVPGGTNGETHYEHVMKGFVGGADGIALDNMVAGDTYEINLERFLDAFPVYNFASLEVVAFVQDDNDKRVYQAAKDQEVEIIVSTDNNAIAGAVVDAPAVVCAGTASYAPTFKLQNGGNAELTSCTITYSINGSTPQVFNWTGSLETLASTEVMLDVVDFEGLADDNNVLSISLSIPNGMVDEDLSNNELMFELAPAPKTVNTVTVEVTTDAYGDEVYWELRNGGGDILGTGGNPNVGLTNIGTNTFPPAFSSLSYGNNQTYTEEIALPAGEDCYTFHITDYYGDGLTGAGGYSVLDHDGNIIHSDTEDYAVQSIKDLNGEGLTSVRDNVLEVGIALSPNPASDFINLDIVPTESMNVRIEFMNQLGQVVSSKQTQLIAGKNQETINVSNYAEGVYFVNIISGDKVASKKVTVIR